MQKEFHDIASQADVIMLEFCLPNVDGYFRRKLIEHLRIAEERGAAEQGRKILAIMEKADVNLRSFILPVGNSRHPCP